MKLFLLIIFLSLATVVQAQTPLANLANSMQPGTWAELTSNGTTATLDSLNGNSGISTVYTDDMVWNSSTRQAFFIGADHLAPQGPIFASYIDSTNTWQRLTRPAWLANATFYHGYDHSAIDSVNGVLYHRPYGVDTAQRYQISTQTWSSLPSLPSGCSACYDALEYFPERGGLVWVRTTGEIWLYSETTHVWSLIANLGASFGGGTWTYAEYDPVHKVLIFGPGGNTPAVYKLAATGVPVRLHDGPAAIYDGSGYVGVFTVDPVTGTFLLLTASSRQFYTFNDVTDVWVLQNNPTKPNMSNRGVIATPISTYGVTLFASCTAGDCRNYLYKHSTSQPPPPQDDFVAQCAAPGVIKCVSFDSPADIAGSWGNSPQGIVPKSSGISPVIDTSVRASGVGSMRMTLPAGLAGGSMGDFFVNFSNDYSVQFGENSDFYIQWRQRFDAGYIQATQTVGMKQAIIGTGSIPGSPASSCTDLELVTQNNFARGVPQMYQNCGRYDPLQQPSGGSDYLIQNARPNPPGCWHYNTAGNCVPYMLEWMTLQNHVHIGPLQLINNQWWYTNSHIDQWVGREGQLSVQTINFGPYNIGPISNNMQKYGQFWALMYSGQQAYPVQAQTWYDNLIISRNKIADPGGVLPPDSPDPPLPTGPPELVGWWKFDDGSGPTAIDSSGKNNNGTIVNMPAWTTGKILAALDFNSTNQYVSANTPNNLTALTYTAWIYPRTNGSLLGGIRYGNMMTKGGAAISKRFLTNSSFGPCAADRVCLEWTVDGCPAGTLQATYVDGVPGSTMTPNVWHHVAATLSASGTCEDDSGGKLDIGLWPNTGAGAFDGKIDDVRVYNYALSAAEILNLFNDIPMPPVPVIDKISPSL